MAETALHRLKQLDQERAALIDGAKQEALARAKETIAELNALGFNYRLVAGERKARAVKGEAASTTSSGKPCPICKFETDPPHDGRRHRAQKRKRAFSPEELQEYGLSRS